MTLDCGHAATPTDFTPGYATVAKTGGKICHSCADAMQRNELNAVDKTVAYVSGDGKAVTTWTGGRLMTITQHGSAPNGWHGSQIHYWRAVDDNNRGWYGRNAGNGMCITMRKAKQQ